MSKAERIATQRRQEEEAGLCPLYGGRCDGVCNIPTDVARLIVDYRTRGDKTNVNHGLPEAFTFKAFSVMEQAKHVSAEFTGIKDKDGDPIMVCRGHKRWAHGYEKVKAVQGECWLPGLLGKIKEE